MKQAKPGECFRPVTIRHHEIRLLKKPCRSIKIIFNNILINVLMSYGGRVVHAPGDIQYERHIPKLGAKLCLDSASQQTAATQASHEKIGIMYSGAAASHMLR